MVEITVAFIWHISLVVKIEEAPGGGTWRQSIWRGSGPCPIRMLLPLLWGGYHRVVCNSRTTHFSKEVLEKLIELFMAWDVAPWYLQNRRRGRAMGKVWCKLPQESSLGEGASLKGWWTSGVTCSSPTRLDGNEIRWPCALEPASFPLSSVHHMYAI